MANNKGNSGQLRYPRDGLYDKYTDYVKFEFYEYKPPFSAVDTKTKPQAYSATGLAESATKASLSTIFLYMPEDIQAAFSADWADKSFTNIQRDLLKTAGAALGTGASAGQTVSNLVTTATNTAGRLPSFVAQSIADGLNKIGGSVSINDVLGGTRGFVLNPNVELLFQGFGLREFDLSYKFTPRNEDEAKDIRKIINTFKVASLPKYGTAGGLGNLNPSAQTSQQSQDKTFNASNDSYISIPNLCQVTYMKGAEAHPYLPKWKLSAITAVDVNYTPDGSYATYSDGSPVATGLSLRFAETKLIFGDDITIDSEEAQY